MNNNNTYIVVTPPNQYNRTRSRIPPDAPKKIIDTTTKREGVLQFLKELPEDELQFKMDD